MLNRPRGDTIIEVLLAVAVFSLVSVGAMTIMNQGTNAAQRALEITLVRQQIDAQAEALRAAHQAYTSKETSVWANIVAMNETGDATPPADGGCPAPDNYAFIMNPKDATLVTGSWFRNMNDSEKPYAQYDPDDLTNPAHGIWIERRELPSTPDIVDSHEFTIRTCWFGAGMGDTPLTIDTVVRLYDPVV